MRVVAIVIGALLLVIAVPSAITGCGVVTSVGDGSRFDIPVADVRAPEAAVAVATPVIDLSGFTIPSWVADTSISLEIDPARDGTAMFGGLASAGDAEAYLDGASIATVDLVEDASGSVRADQDGLDLQYAITPGADSLPPPGDQGFWIRQTEDDRLRISLADLSGRRTVIVLMRADGQPGIAGEVEGALRAPLLRTAAIVLFIGGLIGAAVGAALIVIGIRRREAGPSTAAPNRPPGGPPVDTGSPPTASPAVDTEHPQPPSFRAEASPAQPCRPAVDTGQPPSAPPAVDTDRTS